MADKEVSEEMVFQTLIRGIVGLLLAVIASCNYNNYQKLQNNEQTNITCQALAKVEGFDIRILEKVCLDRQVPTQ